MKVACTSIVAATRFRAEKSTDRAGVADSSESIHCYARSGVHLRQDAVDDAARHVGQPEVAPLIAVSQPFVVDPQ